MNRLIPITLLTLTLGCASISKSPQVPCLRGFQLDVHKTWGHNDSRSLYTVQDDGRGYKLATTNGSLGGADYEEFEFGGSIHFVIGEAPEHCPAYQKPKGPDSRKWVK